MKKEYTPMERAIRYLSQRGLSALELRNKLLRAGVTADDADQVVDDCRRHGFVNDELYAQDCATVLAARGCGKLKIRQELQKRGVAPHARAAMEELGDTELDRAKEAVAYKRRLLTRETDPRKLREKLYRFLIGRGFTPDVIREAVAQTDPAKSARDDFWG